MADAQIQEMTAINTSLSALASVVAALISRQRRVAIAPPFPETTGVRANNARCAGTSPTGTRS